MSIQRLKDGQSLHGIMFRMLQGCAPVELAKNAGFDLIFFDLEHGPMSYETFSIMADHARALDMLSFIRVPELARGHVSRALDCGASGVMIPMLETPAQAAQLVEWAKFPPFGKRGLSSIGAHTAYRRPASARDFMDAADRDTLAIAQIETALAIDNCDAIAQTPGLDVLLIGPNDLAASMGVAGDLKNQAVLDAITHVAECCTRHGKIFGMHAGAPFLSLWTSHGLRLVVNSLDLDALASGFSQVAESSRQIIACAPR